MRRLLLLACWCVMAAAQSAPAFEVVSIKPTPRPTPETVRDGTTRIGFTVEGDRMEIVGYGVLPIVARAFGVEIQQVAAPNFAGFESFAVLAKLPPGASAAQVPQLLQIMLADRFKLKYHRETRDYPVTVLTIGKGGMKLPRLPEGTQESTKTEGSRTKSVGTVKSLFAVMNSFGGFPQMVDQTGLEGMYTWVEERTPARPGQSFQEMTHEAFETMLDAAGLKLESRKVSKETIVVDHIERLPTEN